MFWGGPCPIIASWPRPVWYARGNLEVVMRKVMLAAVAAVGMVVAPLALAGFEDGVAAFESEHFEKAVAELTPLAQAGKIEAMTYLARAYDEGLDDLAKALPWYEKAAGKGDPKAQNRLAQLYDDGQGVAQDTDKALDWYTKAAAQGNDDAQVALGEHYRDDLSDNQTAARYFTQAADKDNPDAQYQLGLLLLGEPGVKRSVPQAWMYLSLAAENADDADEATQARDVLELEMSATETEQARKLLHDWKQNH